MTSPNHAASRPAQPAAAAAAPTSTAVTVDPQPFDPMRGVATSGNGGGVPPGSYEAIFGGAEYLPVKEPDPMTGRGGRQFPAVQFTWKLNDGRTVTRETPANKGTKSSYLQTVGWLLGRTLAGGEPYELAACLGKTYLVTVGPKVNRAGQPTGWHEVTACIPLPSKQS